MQFPSSKVVVATSAAVFTTAAVVLADDGLPVGLAGWLRFVGKVLGSAAVVGALGYRTSETNPPAQLVADIRAGRLPR